MKKVISLSIIFAMFFSAVPVEAADTIVEQIRTLEAQIRALQEQLINLPESSNTPTGANGTNLRESGPVPTATFFRNLSQGMSGEDVKALQQYLVTQGFLVMPGGAAYGYFGPATTQAVQKFQSSRGIEATGFVGTQTRARLNGTPADPTSPVTPVPPSASDKPEITSFISSRSVILPFTSTNLSWWSPNADSCSLLDSSDGLVTPVGIKVDTFQTRNLSESNTYHLTCTNRNGSTSKSLTVAVSSFLPLRVDLKVNGQDSVTVKPGTSVTLSWEASGVTSCTSNIASTVGLSGNKTVMVSSYSMYSISCSSGGRSISDSVIINVEATPPIVPPSTTLTASITATPSAVTSGQTTTLRWTSTNATSCTGSYGGEYFDSSGRLIAFDGIFGVDRATSGTWIPTVRDTTTFTIQCINNSGQTANSSATVKVNPITVSAPVVNFEANPSIITSGQQAKLIVRATNATYCTDPRGNGSPHYMWPMEVSVSPTETKTYSVSCFNSSGMSTTASATVTVNPVSTLAPTATLTANPTSLTSGQTTTLKWSSTNATSCTGSFGGEYVDSSGRTVAFDGVFGTDGATSGTWSPRVSDTTTFTIGCSNSMGQRAYSSAKVTATKVSTPAPTVTLAANPTSITAGQSTQLTWSSTNASYCDDLLDGRSQRGTSGSVTATPSTTTTYSTRCYNSSGYGQAFATVTVTQPPPPPVTPAPTVSLTVNGSTGPSVTLTSGQSYTYSWTSTNSTYCELLSPAVSGVSTSGSSTVTPTHPYYPSPDTSKSVSVRCSNGSQSSPTQTITVNAPSAGHNLTVNGQTGSTTVRSGTAMNVAWDSANMFYCEFTSPFISGVYSSGSLSYGSGTTYYPTATKSTTFTMNCYTHADYIASPRKITSTRSVTVSLASDHTAATLQAIANLLNQIQAQINNLR